MNDDSNERTAAGFGIRSAQEPKYGINPAGRIVNRSTGIAIPDDEPVMIFRAKDVHARDAIAAYLSVCENPDHCAVVRSRLLDFDQFLVDHPERMKEPDSSLQDLAGANVGPRGSGEITIQIQPVKSSNIAGLGYHEPTKTLEVHFASGSKFRYAGVPAQLFTELLQADSKGSFFASRIRGHFPGRTLGATTEQQAA